MKLIKCKRNNGMTLWEAMDIVLSEKPQWTMHAKELAEEITERKLYFQMNGQPIKYNQISARISHKPEYFEYIKGNYARLKKRYDR